MHRHAYKGRKLSLERDQRRALIRGQVTSLVLRESIETTLPKAKEIAPQFERLVTKAKVGTLHAQRQIRTTLLSENAAQKLIQELVPAFEGRQGGYTRIIKTGFRRGDNAAMAVVSLVLPEKLAKAEKDAKGESARSTAAESLAGAVDASQPEPAGGQPMGTPTARRPKSSTDGDGGVTGPANTQKRRTGNK